MQRYQPASSRAQQAGLKASLLHLTTCLSNTGVLHNHPNPLNQPSPQQPQPSLSPPANTRYTRIVSFPNRRRLHQHCQPCSRYQPYFLLPPVTQQAAGARDRPSMADGLDGGRQITDCRFPALFFVALLQLKKPKNILSQVHYDQKDDAMMIRIRIIGDVDRITGVRSVWARFDS